MPNDTSGNDFFSGLDSIALLNSKGTIELNDDGSTVIETPQAVTKAAATKKATTPVVEDSNLIEVDDVEIPTSTKTVNEGNKVVKDELDTDEIELQNSTDDQTGNNQTDDSVQALKEFASALKNAGALESLNEEEFDGTPEGLTQAITNEAVAKANAMVEEYKEALPPIIKYLADNYEEGVPLDQLINIKSNEIRYSSIDQDKLAEDVSLQKEVYRRYLKETTSFSDAKIDKKIQQLEDIGDLASESGEALPELIAFEKQKEAQLKDQTKAQREAQKKAQEAQVAEIKKRAEEYKGKEIVPGLKLTEVETKAIHKSLTTPVGYDKQTGAPISEIQQLRNADPIGFEIKLNYLSRLTKGFTDFSEITKKANTAAISKLESKAANTARLTGGRTNVYDDDAKGGDILSAASKFLGKLK